jgi:hypothetical protein
VAFKTTSRSPERHPARVPGELFGGILQSEGEQEQHDTDLRREVDEVSRELRRGQAAVAEQKPRKEIRGDGTHAEAI